MTIQEYLNEVVTQNIAIGLVKKIYIIDKDGKRVDFSDWQNVNGTNRLIDYGVVETVIEKGFAHFYNKTGDITLRNNDRFFDKPFSATLKDVHGDTATFLKDSNNIINIFKKPGSVSGSEINSRYTYIEIWIDVEILGKIYPQRLATVLLSKLITDTTDAAIIKIDGLIEVLKDTIADTVKDASKNWYQNKPYTFLIKEVLKKAFGIYDASNYAVSLPSGFIIPRFLDFLVAFDSPVYSFFGRPPIQTDTNSDGEPDTYPDTNKICRAIVHDETNGLLYLGIDNELWKFNYTTWIFTLLDTLNSTDYIEYLQIITISNVDYLLIKCRVSNVHDIIVSATKYDSDLKSKTVSTYIKTLPTGSVRQITDSIVEYDSEFSYFGSLGVLMYTSSGSNIYPISLSNWWGKLDKASLDLMSMFSESLVFQDWIGTSDFDITKTNLIAVEGSCEDGVHGATIGNFAWWQAAPSNRMLTLNLPIPFPQKIWLSSIGNVYAAESGKTPSDMFSVYINRVRAFRDTAYIVSEQPEGTEPSWALFEKESSTHDIRREKDAIVELSDGFYSIIAENYSVEYANRYSVNSAVDPAFFTAANNYARCRNIKFSLGQKGINGYHKTSDGYIYEIVVNPETTRVGLNYIENSLMSTATVLTNIQHSTEKADVLTHPTLKVYRLNTLDSTTGRTEMFSVPKLYFEGRELQPLCTAVDATNKILYLFCMLFETLDSSILIDATGAERGREHDTVKYARCLVFEAPLEGYGTYTAFLNDDALNDKSNTTYYIPGTDKVHADGTNFADLSNYLVRLKEGGTNMEHTFYCTNQQISGAKTYFYYEEAGIIVNKIFDIAAGTQNLLPVGNYRSSANGGYLYKMLKRRDHERDNTVWPDGFPDLAMLEAVHYSTNNKIYCSVLAINNISENFVEPLFLIQQKYAICSIETGNFNNFVIIAQFDYQPKHLQIKNGKLYFFLEGEGIMRNINLSDNVLTSHDAANPPVKDELYSLANFDIRETTTPIFYGITSPQGKDRYSFKIPEGKYYLWQYNDEYVPIAELADFTDMTCEQVLAKLCEASNWIMGFDENGNFFMVSRDITYSSPDLTLTEEYDTKIIDFKEKTDTSDELINSCTITPYQTVLENIENNLILKKRLEEKDYPNFTVNIEQRDLKPKTINLTCVRGGEVSMDIEDITKAPLFKWKASLLEVEIIVAVNTSSDTVYLNSVFGGADSEGGIKVNDYIGFINPTTGEYEFKKILTVTSAQNSIVYDIALPSSLFSFTLTKGLSGKIFKSDEVYYSNDIGAIVTEISTATTFTFKVNSLQNIGIGNILRNSTSYKFAKIVNKYENSDGTYTVEVDKAGFATVLNDVLKCYWSPLVSNNVYEIGGSKLFVGVQAKDDLDLANANQRTFKAGDYVQVICKGLKLEQDEMSRQTYVDINSVGTYGLIKEKSAPDNKFLNRPLAKYLAKQIVTKNSKPRYQGTLSSIFLPQLKFVNNANRRLFVVRVQNSKLFPLLQNNSVDFYVTSIKHNLGKRQTEFSVRGVKGIGEV